MRTLLPLRTWLAAMALASSACHTTTPNAGSALQAISGPDLDFYEARRVSGERPQSPWSAFASTTGIVVTQRDAQGNATEGTITVLSDNPGNKIHVIGDFNDWGKKLRPGDELKPLANNPAYVGATIRPLTHLMEYRLLVNGKQVLDPNAYLYTTPELNAKLGRPTSPAYLNSVFWDHGHPQAYKMKAPAADLRDKPVVIAESEVWELVAKWPRTGGVGPDKVQDTYRFVAESGVVDELKKAGYNAVEFLPFNQSVDGDRWHFRYQVYGLFAPESKYGTPDEFAMMIDAFNKAGMAVIMDSVVGHYPYQANQGARALDDIGLHQWKKADGKALYGQEGSPWGTNRYDYANPYVRRFLADSILFMLKNYRIAGIRFDNLDGIRLYSGPGGGGDTFLKLLVGEIRKYQPENLLIAEMFFGYNPVLQARADGGYGINFRTHSDLFDFFKDNMLQRTEDINMAMLRDAVRNPWGWGEAARCQYVTNHDEAANRRNGATGSYVATLLNGGGWWYVEKKTIAFASLAMLSGSVYLDMPQLRLLQEGSFSDNPAVDWGLRKLDSQAKVYAYFRDLASAFRDNEAFAFRNFHANVENHTDYQGHVISLRRINARTGKSTYAIVNLSHQEYRGYNFGVDANQPLKVVVDSNRKEYGGSGQLAQALAGADLAIENQGNHGKAHSVTVPVLAPYAVLLLEEK